jgi:hydrogenase nickel incorporation protein HypA/HybF
MHELVITQSIVDLCAERAGGARVSVVTVEVGRLSGVVPDALRFCYDACTAGTPLEGSQLDVIETDAVAQCRTCGCESEPADFLAPCPCGSFDLVYSRGEGLRIRHMEVI